MICAMRLPVVGVIVAALALSAGLVWQGTGSAGAVPAEAVPAVLPGAAVVHARGREMVERGAPGAASYAQVARLFEIGFAGGVIVSEDTRASIEAALAALSDPPTADEMREFERVLQGSLPHGDAQRVLALTQGYAGYANELKGELGQHGLPGSLAEFDASMARVAAIRERHFDATTIQALFGPHDGHARVAVEAAFVEADPALSIEQKRQRLAELRAQLPQAQRDLIPEPRS